MALRFDLHQLKLIDRTASFSLREKVLLAIIFILFSLFFLPSIHRSLWIDETITYWVIKDGFWDLIHRAIHFQGQSPFYYFVVWCFIQIFGHTEWILRLPSLLSLIITCIILYKLGLYFFNREGGLIATLSFINLWAVIVQPLGGSCSARPYELAVMFSVYSILCFVWWVKTERVIYQVAYIMASVATCYAHILFAPVLFIHFCCFLINRKNDSKVSYKKLFFTFGIVVFCLLPNIYQLMLLYLKKELYSFSTMPTVINLIHAWFPRMLLTPLITWYIISCVLERKLYWIKVNFSSKRFFFFLVWYFFPSLFWVVTSQLAGASIFLLRYYCWSFPALALIIASFIIAMESERSKMITIIVLSILLTYINILVPKPLEDWRAATEYVNRIGISNKVDTLIWPGLMEQRNLDWLKRPENQDYLLAPFSFYRLQKKAIVLPLIPNKLKLEALLSQNDISITNQKTKIYLMLRDIYVNERRMPKSITGQKIIEDWLNLNGYSLVQKKLFGGVVVSQFLFNSDK